MNPVLFGLGRQFFVRLVLAFRVKGKKMGARRRAHGAGPRQKVGILKWEVFEVGSRNAEVGIKERRTARGSRPGQKVGNRRIRKWECRRGKGKDRRWEVGKDRGALRLRSASLFEHLIF
jgi:hypothetical protein